MAAVLNAIIPIRVECPCRGIYEKKFVALQSDGTSGATTTKKLWCDVRNGLKPWNLVNPVHVLY